jgi:hypothetical protein
MKKFLLPFQNMVRADLFSGSLAVWNALGFRIHFARPPIPSRAVRDEERIPFELIQEYTASQENASLKRLPRPAVGGTRLGFERAFLAKRKRI